MLRVGLTGGIGSGKTTVREVFELLGLPVYDADSRAKYLMANDPELGQKLVREFGKSTFSSSGELNRRYLSDLVFDDPEKLRNLNSMVHPAVHADFQLWSADLGQTKPYCLYEAALVFEGGSAQRLDRVITVYCDRETRISRVMGRDNVNRDRVLERMRNQMPETEKCIAADFIIINDGKHLLVPQVIDIDMQLRAESENE